MKQIMIKGYPFDLAFKTKKALPPFKYGCRVRTALAHKALAKDQREISCHLPADFIVEQIEKTSVGEVWHLGS